MAVLVTACFAVPARAQATRPATDAVRDRLLSKPVIAGFLVSLRSRDAEARVEAAAALGTATHTTEIKLIWEPLLDAALGDVDPAVRRRAADSLRALLPHAQGQQQNDVTVALLAIAADDAARGRAGLAQGVPAAPPATRPAAGLINDAAAAAEAVLAARRAEAIKKLVPSLAALLENPKTPAGERLATIRLLREFGPAAGDAVPALIGALRMPDPATAAEAIDTLVAVGPGAIMPLAREATAPRASLALAPIIIAKIGGRAAAAVPELGATLAKHPWASERIAAAWALGVIGPAGGDAAAGHLTAALRDPDGDVRRASLAALPKVQPQADNEVAEHIVNLYDFAPSSKLVAIRGLVRLADKPGAAEALGDALRSDSPLIRYEATRGLSAIGRRAAPAAVELVHLLRTRPKDVEPGFREDARSRELAMVTLMRLGPDARDAVKPLTHMLAVPHTEAIAAEALTTIGAPAISALTALAADPKPITVAARLSAIQILGAIYPAEDPAVAVLATALRDKDPDVRRAAVDALAAAAPPPRAAREALVGAVRDPDPGIRATAIRTLSVLKLANLAAAGAERRPEAVLTAAEVPAVVPLLSDMDTENPVRVQLVGLLAPLGGDALPAIPVLLRMADSRRPYVRRAAAGALAWIDPKGEAAGAALVAAVINKDAGNRRLLVATVGRSPTPEPLLKRLNALAEADDDPAVRSEARAALDDLGQVAPKR